jgi:hypothetical protein
MTRIVSFGCSYTYGQGLEDCHIDPNLPGPEPSKFAWPNLAAEQLGYGCLNLSKPGFSNLAILDAIINYNFEPNDIVAVMWTFKSRYMEYSLPNEVIHKGRWFPDWLDSQNMFDLIIKNYLHIHHAYSYLKFKKIPYYFFDSDIYFDAKDEKPKWFTQIDFVPFNFKTYEFFPPLGLDGKHPGPVFHKTVANTLVRSLKNSIDISP